MVVRLSEATVAVRRGEERVVLAAPGDAAVVRPGDCIVRALSPHSPTPVYKIK